MARPAELPHLDELRVDEVDVVMHDRRRILRIVGNQLDLHAFP